MSRVVSDDEGVLDTNASVERNGISGGKAAGGATVFGAVTNYGVGLPLAALALVVASVPSCATSFLGAVFVASRRAAPLGLNNAFLSSSSFGFRYAGATDARSFTARDSKVAMRLHVQVVEKTRLIFSRGRRGGTA
eukprot:TRINITY_DN64883_c0_g1_i1.p1 TRINITY_DN64883_c0_g1~~TRINITY_DN64883_c0_g1_i1.p1  ORF type:complete len:136 (-),score=25.60 TRINITY_DN64883_c0_g1_i1:55-462(-)